MRFAYASTTAAAPGGSTVVDSRSSTMAGPAIGGPGRQRVAIVDRRVHEPATLGEVGRTLALARVAIARRRRLGEAHTRRAAHRRQLPRHDLDRFVRRRVPVARGVDVVEPRAHGGQGGGVEPARRHRHRELVALPHVARVGRAHQRDLRRHRGLPDDLDRLRGHVVVHRGHGRRVERVEPADVGARHVELHLGGEESDRRRHAGRGGQDHARDAERLREAAAVHRPGAAERHERQVARIAAALDRHHARGQLHVGVDDRVDAPRGLLHREAEGARELLIERARGAGRVERHRAAGEVVRVEVAEHEVRVGDGRLAPAAPVAHGSRRGRRALGADGDHAEPGRGDRSAAGADLDEVDGLDVHGQAAARRVVHAVQLERGRGGRAAALDQASLAVVPPMSNAIRSWWPVSSP